MRHVFYAVSGKGLVPKTENGYRTVASLMKNLRLTGELPWNYVADNTRFKLASAMFTGLVDFLDQVESVYRRDIMRDVDVTIEIWSEKDAISSILADKAELWGVPVFINRGYPSLTFLHSSAVELETIGKPAYIYYFGDSDPSGKDIERNTESRLRKFAPNTEITFERMAVTEEQIEKFGLPTRPPKAGDSRNGKYNGGIVEIDTLPMKYLGGLVEYCITRNISSATLDRMLKIEAAEKETLRNYFNQIKKFVGKGGDSSG